MTRLCFADSYLEAPRIGRVFIPSNSPRGRTASRCAVSPDARSPARSGPTAPAEWGCPLRLVCHTGVLRQRPEQADSGRRSDSQRFICGTGSPTGPLVWLRSAWADSPAQGASCVPSRRSGNRASYSRRMSLLEGVGRQPGAVADQAVAAHAGRSINGSGTAGAPAPAPGRAAHRCAPAPPPPGLPERGGIGCGRAPGNAVHPAGRVLAARRQPPAASSYRYRFSGG